ncbi:MAG: hypothetical protein QXR71_03325 [Candidatus Aenigmatarchaeota archaeon]
MDKKLIEFANLAKKVNRIFAKTYAEKAPHWYVVYNKNNEDIKKLFDLFNKLIVKSGVKGKFNPRTYKYFFVDGYK